MVTNNLTAKLDVIEERLNHLVQSMDEHKQTTKESFITLTNTIKNDILPEVRKNSEFRLGFQAINKQKMIIYGSAMSVFTVILSVVLNHLWR